MNRILSGGCAALGLITILGACAPVAKSKNSVATESRSIEAVAWDAIARGAPVIDVRTDAEFREGHLPGAVNIPYDQIVARRAELPADPTEPVVLYCRTGRRSGIAKHSLEQMGFTNAINAGGYGELMQAGPR